MATERQDVEIIITRPAYAKALSVTYAGLPETKDFSGEISSATGLAEKMRPLFKALELQETEREKEVTALTKTSENLDLPEDIRALAKKKLAQWAEPPVEA